MIKIGKKNNIEVVCLLTNMNIPLGNNIGNALEIKEAIDVLNNQKQNNLSSLCIELSAHMVSLGLEISYEEAKQLVKEKLSSKEAYNKFLEFIHAQGGSLENLPETSHKYEIKSPKEGYLTNIDALELGKLSMQLGAGRTDLTSKIDYGAGIIVKKNIGDYVNKGDILMTLYTNKNLKASIMNTPVFEIKKTKPDTPKLIYDIIR